MVVWSDVHVRYMWWIMISFVQMISCLPFLTSDILSSLLFYFVIQQWILTKNYTSLKLGSDLDAYELYLYSSSHHAEDGHKWLKNMLVTSMQ